MLILFVFFLSLAQCHPVLWVGGVGPNSASFRAVDYNGLEFKLSTTAGLSSNIIFSQNVLSSPANIEVANLTEGTVYYYGFPSSDMGTFRTTKTGQYSFTFGFGSCGATGSNSNVWSELQSHNLDFFVHMGDLHYENIVDNDQTLYINAFRSVFDSPSQRAFYQSLAMAYVWDDHDFGTNNADSSSPSRTAAKLGYMAAFPHYTLVGGTTSQAGIYQAFTIGNVRFIMTDLRYEAVPVSRPNGTIMSATQTEWFFSELSKASSYSLVVWVSSRPWIGASNPGDDRWDGWPDDRTRIANFIKKNRINNIVMISGDAHMVAIDSGQNSDYADGGGAGFPVFQAAPLDQWGSVKGGPFSEGCFTYQQNYVEQYAVMQVTDTPGQATCITVTGYRAQDLLQPSQQLVTYSTCVPLVMSGTPGAGSCSVDIVPLWAYIVIGVSFGLALVLIIVGIVCCCRLNPKQLSACIVVLMLIVLTLGCGGALPLTRYLESMTSTRPIFLPVYIGFIMIGVVAICTCVFLVGFCCTWKNDKTRKRRGKSGKFELI